MNLITIFFKIRNASPLAFHLQFSTKSQYQISAIKIYEPLKLVDELPPQRNPELIIIVLREKFQAQKY